MSSPEKPKNNKDKIELLKERNIISFDIGLTAEEKDSIDELRIETQLPQFNSYGPINDEAIETLTAYLSGLGKNSEETKISISKLVARIAEGMIKDFDAESAWVMLRSFLPNDKFKIPRWHKDGSYFASKERVYKLIFSIKGAPTRLGEATDAEKFEQLEKEGLENLVTNRISGDNPKKFEDEDIRIRKELASVVKEIEPLEVGHAAMYLIGDKDAVIHSEPLIDEPRIFMSVIVGSQDQINEWKEKSNPDKK